MIGNMLFTNNIYIVCYILLTEIQNLRPNDWKRMCFEEIINSRKNCSSGESMDMHEFHWFSKLYQIMKM